MAITEARAHHFAEMLRRMVVAMPTAIRCAVDRDSELRRRTKRLRTNIEVGPNAPSPVDVQSSSIASGVARAVYGRRRIVRDRTEVALPVDHGSERKILHQRTSASYTPCHRAG